MQNSCITHNILESVYHKLDDDRIINLLYDWNNTIFDLVFLGNPYVHIDHKPNPNIGYVAYWTSNPIAYTSIADNIKSLHIHDIIYYRDNPGANIKKEDKFLLQNKFVRSTQICRNSNIGSLWTINNIIPLEYGVPDLTNQIDYSKPRGGSVVVMNTQKLKSINILYKYIQQYWPNAVMIEDIPNTGLQGIVDTIKNYKVCIAAEDSYNILFGVAAGCAVLSNKSIGNVPCYEFIDMPSLLEGINSSIKTYDSDHIQQLIPELLQQYNLNVFYTHIKQYVLSCISNPVIL